MRTTMTALFALCCLSGMLACASPGDPADGSARTFVDDGSLRIAALDYQIGDLNDPAELAKFTRAELLVVSPWQFWNNNKSLTQLRTANPRLRILAYFRTKAIRQEWNTPPTTGRIFTYDLYQAAQPFLARTTTGDTVSDWPGALVFDFTDPAAREAMLAVFFHYQTTSANRFDGIFWDYFSPRLWISPEVTGMEGEPDLDGDGIPHAEDADEQQAFLDGQDAWVNDARRTLGDRFIQIANGERALIDSTFAARFDGMFYEQFPGTAFGGRERILRALDPSLPNNLWAARNWPRRQNGGPWLVLSQMRDVGSYQNVQGEWLPVDADDLTRAMALLTGATAITYDDSGTRSAGVPAVEIDLGAPLGPVVVDGNAYVRDYEEGRLEIYMGSGEYPTPFDFRITQGGQVIQEFDFPAVTR